MVWKVNAGDGFSGPVTAGNRVLLFDQVQGQANLRCLDAQKGTVLWRSSYPCRFIGGLAGGGAGPRATPLIVDDLVVTFGPNGVLRCVRLADGEQVWSRDLKKEYHIPEGFFGISSTPAVVGGKLIVNVGGGEAGIAAFDCKTGETLWQSTDDEASYASPVIATVDGRTLAYVFARSGLHCLEADTGKELYFFRWRARISASVNAATPLVIRDRVFITSSYNTGAAMLQTTADGSKTLWSGQDILSSQYNTPVYFEGCIIGIDGRADVGRADLVCIDAETGERKWTEPDYGCASILLADGKLILFSDAGTLELAKADTKRFVSLGKVQLFDGTDCRAHPALAEGRLYVRGPAELLCIDFRKKN